MAVSTRSLLPLGAATLAILLSLGTGAIRLGTWLGIESLSIPTQSLDRLMLEGSRTRVSYPPELSRQAIIVRAALERALQQSTRNLDSEQGSISTASEAATPGKQLQKLEIMLYGSPRKLGDDRWGVMFAPRPGGVELSAHSTRVYAAAFGGDDPYGEQLSLRILKALGLEEP